MSDTSHAGSSRPPPLDTSADAQLRSEAAAVATHAERKPRIVIVGGGFGGVAAARALRKSDAEVFLIDRRNHHIFQPLLYQVATAVLSPSEVAAPIRQLARKQKNLSVMLAEVTELDLKSRSVTIRSDGIGTRIVPFDYLILAPGMQASYFGHDEFAEYAPSLKTLADGETIRAKILGAYEKAELTEDPAERARLLTFVLVGAGPTGVELAASIAQMATITFHSNFRNIDPSKTSITLLDGAKRILPSFAESLSRKAAKRLERLGVKILTDAKVDKVDDQGVIVAGKRLESATVLWTAGVAPSPILKLCQDRSRRTRLCHPVPYAARSRIRIRGRRWRHACSDGRSTIAGRRPGRDPGRPVCGPVHHGAYQDWPRAHPPLPVLRQGQHGRGRPRTLRFLKPTELFRSQSIRVYSMMPVVDWLCFAAPIN